MAQALGMTPRSLIKNIPSRKQGWKAPVKEWVRNLFEEKFGNVELERLYIPSAGGKLPAVQAGVAGARKPHNEFEGPHWGIDDYGEAPDWLGDDDPVFLPPYADSRQPAALAPAEDFHQGITDEDVPF